MSDYVRERQLQKKREYYRKWRADHRDSVRASQVRYWTKKAAETAATTDIPAVAETRSTEDPAR